MNIPNPAHENAVLYYPIYTSCTCYSLVSILLFSMQMSSPYVTKSILSSVNKLQLKCCGGIIEQYWFLL